MEYFQFSFDNFLPQQQNGGLERESALIVISYFYCRRTRRHFKSSALIYFEVQTTKKTFSQRIQIQV